MGRYSNPRPNRQTSSRPGCGCGPLLIVLLLVIVPLATLGYIIKTSNYQTATAGQKIAQVLATRNKDVRWMTVELTLYNPDGSTSHYPKQLVEGEDWMLNVDVIRYPSWTNMQPDYKIVALAGANRMNASFQEDEKNQIILNNGEDIYYKFFQTLSWAYEVKKYAPPVSQLPYDLYLNANGTIRTQQEKLPA